MGGAIGSSIHLIAVGAAALALLACSAPPPGPPARGPSPTLSPTVQATTVDEGDYARQRRRMVEQDMRRRDVTDERVLAVMEKVPRHLFVPEERRARAYDDAALPIGLGQTISQPYIVAIMTQLLDLKEGDRVLEIGTGSGYQAAVLAELTPNVYSMEILAPLAERAERELRELGYHQVRLKVDDGYYGWEEHAPYDAIIVTCAPDHVPQPLVAQLKDGGRLVIPIGPPGFFQSLWKIEKRGGQVISRNVMGVAFVPMTGAAEKD